MDQAEDRAAVQRLQGGDIGGLEVLVRRYQVQAVGTAYLISWDRALAEDVVQAAFLRVFDRSAQFDLDRPFGPWFIRSVVNDVLKALDRRARYVDLEADPDGAAYQLVSPDPSPEERLEAAESSAAIWAVLGKLAPEQRAAIVLRYYLGLSEREMAARLACPPSTVKWRLHAARRRLRDLLPAWLRPADWPPGGGAGEAGPPAPLGTNGEQR